MNVNEPSNIESPGGPFYPPPRYQAPRHGLHVAGIALGVFGSVFGLIPLLGIVAFPCGVLAVLFGWMAWRAGKQVGVKQGRAAIILGVLALVLGVIGMVIVNDALNDLDEDLEEIDNGSDGDSEEEFIENLDDEQREAINDLGDCARQFNAGDLTADQFQACIEGLG